MNGEKTCVYEEKGNFRVVSQTEKILWCINGASGDGRAITGGGGAEMFPTEVHVVIKDKWGASNKAVDEVLEGKTYFWGATWGAALVTDMINFVDVLALHPELKELAIEVTSEFEREGPDEAKYMKVITDMFW